jgi:hypothetical protein
MGNLLLARERVGAACVLERGRVFAVPLPNIDATENGLSNVGDCPLEPGAPVRQEAGAMIVAALCLVAVAV